MKSMKPTPVKKAGAKMSKTKVKYGTEKIGIYKPMSTSETLAGKTVNVAKKATTGVKPPKATRSVEKYKGIYSRTVDGKDQMVKEKGKTVTKGGLTKKTVVKGKGVKGSVIGKYKEVKRFK